MTDTDNKPGVEEMYLTARNTSDLSVVLHHPGAVDVLAAAGWSARMFGSALARLHSEWDVTSKPEPLGKMAALRIAAQAKTNSDGMVEITGSNGQTVETLSPTSYARRMVAQWNASATLAVVLRLKELPGVRDHLTIKATQWGMSDAQTKATDVVRYWLHDKCGLCHGTQWQTAEGTGRHTGKACTECKGSGVGPVPHGLEGRRLANYMDKALQVRTAHLRSVLRMGRRRDYNPR